MLKKESKQSFKRVVFIIYVCFLWGKQNKRLKVYDVGNNDFDYC